MVTAGDLRKGTTFIYDGKLCVVVDFQHVKPGKGSAFVRVKIRNIIAGSNIETTFNPTDKFETAQVEKAEMTYLYNDGEMYYLMDTNTYEQVGLTAEDMGDALKYIKENDTVTTSAFEGKIFLVEPPMFVELEVTYTEPGFAGNTTTTSGKPATLENGLEISVPMFVEIGDRIRIDTRTGEYMERI